VSGCQKLQYDGLAQDALWAVPTTHMATVGVKGIIVP